MNIDTGTVLGLLVVEFPFAYYLLGLSIPQSLLPRAN
jgi:hypothetical protein